MKASLFNNLQSELVLRATKSQGPGGQHVNKVNSRIELRFSIRESKVLSELQKERLENFFRSRVTASGELIIIAQGSRSQFANKEEAIARFYAMVEKALAPRIARMPTHATRLSIRKRLESKKRLSQKKNSRTNRDYASEIN